MNHIVQFHIAFASIKKQNMFEYNIMISNKIINTDEIIFLKLSGLNIFFFKLEKYPIP